MTLDQIIQTIDIVIDGRPIVSGIGIVRDGGEYQLWANLLNHDGAGQAQTMLAAFADAPQAVAVKRVLEPRASQFARSISR